MPLKVKQLRIEDDCRNCPFAQEDEGQVFCIARTKRPRNTPSQFLDHKRFVVGERASKKCSECNQHRTWGEVNWTPLDELQCPLPDAK